MPWLPPVLWLGTTNGLAAAMPDSFNPDGFTASVDILSAMLALSVAISVLSEYLTSAIAHARTLKPVWALGAILLAVGISAQIQYWNALPVWHHLTFLGLLIPGALLGGGMRTRGSRTSRPAIA